MRPEPTGGSQDPLISVHIKSEPLKRELMTSPVVHFLFQDFRQRRVQAPSEHSDTSPLSLSLVWLLWDVCHRDCGREEAAINFTKHFHLLHLIHTVNLTSAKPFVSEAVNLPACTAAARWRAPFTANRPWQVESVSVLPEPLPLLMTRPSMCFLSRSSPHPPPCFLSPSRMKTSVALHWFLSARTPPFPVRLSVFLSAGKQLLF